MANQATIEKHERENEVVQAERTRSGRVYRPNVDIIERADELLLMADVPGVRGEDVDIQYENGLLSIRAAVNPRQREGAASCVWCEYGIGDFERSFQVGEGIDPARIQAECANGVLTVHLPKTEAVKPRKITVKTT